mgnify:CR=1 FL=1
MNQTHTEYSIIPDQKDIPSLAFITLLTNTVFIAIMFFLVKLYDQCNFLAVEVLINYFRFWSTAS